ncbi:MAG: ketopantoate reductase family protein [Gammaproteobacteria bacterium]
MRIAVVGCGAIGGLIAARLALAGESVTVVDKPEVLVAVDSRGLRLHETDGVMRTARVRCASSAQSIGEQEAILLAVKANDLPTVAPDLSEMFGEQTFVVTLQNGLPWWYFQGLEGSYRNYRLRSLDGDGVLEQCIPVSRLIGCVAYPAASVVSPGEIRLIEGERFTFGEPAGGATPRAESIVSAFQAAGFKSYLTDDIRGEMWLKAWGALSFNPVSALTGATMREICDFPETARLVRNMMAEAQQIAEKLGVSIRHTIDKRIEGARAVGAHKTSMLQDREAGRPMEIAALVGVFVELAELVGVAAPCIQTVHACTRLLDHTLQRASGRTAACV